MGVAPAMRHAPAHGARMRAANGTAGLEVADLPHADRLAAVRTGELGSVHSWELVTAVDGPGTRLTTFLAGCPLRCLYCHNPDTLEVRRGQSITAGAVVARMARYAALLKASGGGVTLSGGEPLMQPAFLARLLRGAKDLGLHTAIDTSGNLGARCPDVILDDVDLVLLDVKAGDETTYRRVTGRELAPTLTFGRRLAQRGTPVWLRFVLVPGLTDAPDNVAAVAEYAASLGNVERVEVLPFHQMGRDKWDALGMTYQLQTTAPPTAAQTEHAREVFRSRGLVTY